MQGPVARGDHDDVIIRMWRQGKTLAEIATWVGVWGSCVAARARKLRADGVITMTGRPRQPWTEQDDANLRGMVGWMDPVSIAKVMHRRANGVEKRISLLGLTRRWRGAYSALEVAKLVGVTNKVVLRWINTGAISATRADIRWRIEHEELERFIQTRHDLFERAKITDDWWRDVAYRGSSFDALVPTATAAQMLHVSTTTLLRAVREGRLPARRAGKYRGWYIERAAVDAALQRQRAGGTI